MANEFKPDVNLMRSALRCKCPRCGEGRLFQGKWSMDVVKKCGHCGLDLSGEDSADGPAVFLIFILGFSLVPLALWLDYAFIIPLWAHGIIWTIVTLALTLGSLRPLKSYIIGLQYKYRPDDLGGNDEE